ncbi:hypothetical protein [Cryptosporangium arvum]|uniref:hypothetical protein n=1 Tax=Cryptosporangium arvum TaxID=80871 RepID=UPI000569785A|nr:hypothetical protein [Cryptosporangium arvum]
MNAIVLPIGHYQGVVHPSGHHVVRMGWEPIPLDDDGPLDVWGFAHGLPEHEGAWDRSEVIAAAVGVGVQDAEPILDALLDRGLVVEVTPGTDGAREFAGYHRVAPLLIGLGRPDGEELDGLGIPGLSVALRARPRVIEVWEWAHLWPDLWSACEALAEAARDTGSLDASETDPDQVLSFVLGALQDLVAHGAAYLDHRASPGPRG